MSINITKQLNQNECGICVLTSLCKHFYGNKVDKITILEESKLNKNGLSIYDFEILGQKLGISCEAYEMEWSEFISYPSNDYLVIPIQIDAGLHYVIVKKHRHYLQVFDSRYEEPKNVHYDEFSKYFVKIVIVIDKFKQSFKFPTNSKFDLLRNVRASYLIVSILIQIAIVALTTISANYLNIIINNSISNSSFKNGLIITFIFLSIFLVNGLTKYVFKLFCTRGFKQCFNYLSSNLVNSLNSKNGEFLNKIDKNYFYLIDSAIQSISNFLTIEISSFCSNVFLSIVTIVIITCINPTFLIVSIILIAATLLIGFVQYNFKKKIISQAISNQNINNNISREYIEYFTNQNNFLIRQKLSNDLKNNYSKFMYIYIKKSRFDCLFLFSSELIYNIIYFILILITTFFIITKHNMNVGQLTFVIALVGMLHSSIDGISDFVIKKIEYKTMIEIYESFIRVGNAKQNGSIKIDKIHSIAIKRDDELYEIKNGDHINQKDSDAIFLSVKEKSNSLLINNVDICNVDISEFNNTIFCLNINSVIKKEWLIEKINDQNEIIMEGLRLFNINLSSQNRLTLQEQTLVNLLYTACLDSKLILFEDNLRYLTKQQVQWTRQTLMQHIKRNNFVLERS